MSDMTLDHPWRARLLMLASVVCFAVMNALIKHLAERYDVLQLMFARSLFALLPFGFLLFWAWGRKILVVTHWRGVLWRSTFGVLSMFCLFYSVKHLPLADAIAINFSGPIFTALFATLGLKEPTDWRYWLAVLLGFAGVLVIVDPVGGTHAPLATFVAVIGSVFYGLAMVGVRFLAKTEHPLSIIFWFSLLATLASGILVLTTGIPVTTPADWGLFALTGLLALGVQLGLTLAYLNAPATVVAPVNYISIIFVTALGSLIWHEQPGVNLFIGTVIVVIANLAIVKLTARRGVVAAATPD